MEDATAPSSPLATAFDPAHLGAAILLTSACWDLDEQVFRCGDLCHIHDEGSAVHGAKATVVPQQDEEIAEDPGTVKVKLDNGQEVILRPVNLQKVGDSLSQHLFVHGGRYRHESQADYYRQSLRAAELFAEALLQIGVPPGRIHHWDFADGTPADTDVQGAIRDLLRRLPPNIPDALLYYVGPALHDGTWALSWRDAEEELCHRLIRPDGANDPLEECILPPPEASSPGHRLVVADSPYSLRAWLRPAARLRGLAAWDGPGMASTSRGPALTRWLVGQFSAAPPGACGFLEPPPDAGLCRIPAFKPLFWAPLPGSDSASALLWELEEFLGAPVQHERRAAANLELLAHGGVALLTTLLTVIGPEAADAVLLQCLWILHSLVLNTPLSRWVGTMDELLLAVLALPQCRSPCSDAVLAYALSLAAACAARCTGCRSRCAGDAQPIVLGLILDALGGQDGPKVANAAAAAAGCRLAAQLANQMMLDTTTHARLLSSLQLALCRDSPDEGETVALAGEEALRAAASEALLFACLRSNAVKLKVLANLGASGRFKAVLRSSGSAAAGKLLALLRSAACAEPLDAVLEGLDEEIAGVVVACLQRFPTDAAVQRWGLSSVGVLATADTKYARRCGRGAGDCVLSALRAEAFASNLAVLQEGMFCANALLLRGEGGLEAGRRELAGLASRAIHVGLRSRSKPGSECTSWGLKVLERLACVPRVGPVAVEPTTGTIVEVLVSPQLTYGEAEVACTVIAYLVAGSPSAKSRLRPYRVKLVKAVQALAWALREAEGKRSDKAASLQAWVGVLCDALGEPRPLPDDDDGMMPVVRDIEEEDPQVTSEI